MQLTHHPFQRVGAWSAAALLGRPSPQDVAEADLGVLVERIVRDAMMAAVAVKDGPGWAWMQRLGKMFASSPATYPRRAMWGPEEVARRITDLFAADDAGEHPALPCWACEAPTSVRWGRDLWPLTHSGRYVNAQPEGGQPSCRACRVAVWSLPYGVVNDAFRVQSVTSSDPALEWAIAAANVAVSVRAVGEGWSEWPSSDRPHTVLGDALLRTLAERPGQVGGDLEVQQWLNSGREAALDILRVPGDVARWYVTHIAPDEEMRAALWDAVVEQGGDPLRALATRVDGSGWPLLSRLRRVIGERIEADATLEELEPLIWIAASWARCAGLGRMRPPLEIHLKVP